MNEVSEFFSKLFDTADWPPRWHCGQWTSFHGWLYIVSDLLIWSAYFAIPVVILRYISKKQGIRFVRLYFLFAAFILACGATHLLDAIAFWFPLYRLNALVLFVTGVISWVTVFYLVKNLPLLFSMRSQKALEAEIELRKRSEEKFKGLLEAAPDAMVIVDAKGEIVLINRQTEKLFGYTKEELSGRSVELLVPVGLRAKHEDYRAQYSKDPKVRSMGSGLELFAVRKDGSTFPVEISLSPIHKDDGALVSASIRDITLRKKEEEKLKIAKKDFQLLVSSVKDYAIFLLDKAGHVASWNTGAEQIKGYTADEIIGQHFSIFYTDEQKEAGEPEKNLQLTLQKGHFETEGLRVRKDGSTFFADVVFTSLIDDDGKLYGFAKVTRDISEKRKVDERNRFLASIADNIKDPVISTDTDFNITRWNTPAEELFEWKSEEAIGKKTNDILNAIYPNETSEEILISFNDKDYWEGELIYHTKAGKPVKVLATVSHLKDAEGKIAGNLTIVRDITKRKNAEDALIKLNSELEQKVKERTQVVVKTMEEKNTILESIGDAFFAVDKNWKVTYWNRIAEKDLSVPKESIVGNNLWEIFSDSIESVSYKKYHEAMATGQVVHFEDYYAPLNKWYEVSAYPSGNGLSVYFKDITERKGAAEEIKKLNSELEERVLKRTEQLKKSTEEMEAFSYSISHDLRAPLRGIIGFANILEEDYGIKLDDEARRITNVIKKNTTRMGMLIDDLLSFSRTGRQELVKTNVDSNKLVKDVIAEVGPDRKRIEWILRPLPVVKADANTLKQVWINLISNAKKYSGNADKPKIEIGSIQKKGSITFFIKDNGVGFDEKYKAKLFKVFQRLHTNEEFEGTGIGLAIVDKIISKHGGEVWVEAELNKGATFYFSLPVDKE